LKVDEGGRDKALIFAAYCELAVLNALNYLPISRFGSVQNIYIVRFEASQLRRPRLEIFSFFPWGHQCRWT